MNDAERFLSNILGQQLGEERETVEPECDMPLDPDKKHMTILYSDFIVILKAAASLQAISNMEKFIQKSTKRKVVFERLRDKIAGNLTVIMNKYPRTILDDEPLSRFVECFNVPFDEEIYKRAMNHEPEFDIDVLHAELHLLSELYNSSVEVDEINDKEIYTSILLDKQLGRIIKGEDDD